MAPLTIGTAAMIATRMYSRSSLGPPGTNSALLNTAWMSSGLTMPIVEVSTMSPTTAATRPRYGLNSGITRRAVFRPTCACGPRLVIRPLSHRPGPGRRPVPPRVVPDRTRRVRVAVLCEHGSVPGFDGEKYLRLLGERWVRKGGAARRPPHSPVLAAAAAALVAVD